MAKIIGNTTVTPMTVPDFAQTDERKADYIKNKKISYLENDIGYAEKAYVDDKVGEIGKVLDEIRDTGIADIYSTADDTGRQMVVIITLKDGRQLSFGVPYGEEGKTPVKGVDYWTEEDKAEIISELPSGGVYELIETIETTEAMTIDRTNEPDGTAYNFKAMFIRINSTATSASDTSINIYTRGKQGGTHLVASCYIANFNNNTGTRRCYAEAYQHFGYWAGKYSRWGTSQYEGNPHQGPYHTLRMNIKDYVYLSRAIIQSCPASSTVEIWGVRNNEA